MCSARPPGASPGSRSRCSRQATRTSGAPERMADGAIAIIVNGASGTAQRDEVLETAFAKHGLRAQIHAARSGAELAELAQRAAAARPRVIVAAGGDGTL